MTAFSRIVLLLLVILSGSAAIDSEGRELKADRGSMGRGSTGRGSTGGYVAAAGAGYLIGNAAARSHRDENYRASNSTGYGNGQQSRPHMFFFPPLLLAGLLYLFIKRRQNRLAEQNNAANEIYVATPVPANGQSAGGGLPMAVAVPVRPQAISSI
jgi:hypothetical protein